ncbi:hypothetical protein B0H11DRAFT_1906481 [Mycena galericulata]|nr:hypothetical protein B0H11DRAFT_1906481 [Mycena galericulata]
MHWQDEDDAIEYIIDYRHTGLSHGPSSITARVCFYSLYRNNHRPQTRTWAQRPSEGSSKVTKVDCTLSQLPDSCSTPCARKGGARRLRLVRSVHNPYALSLLVVFTAAALLDPNGHLQLMQSQDRGSCVRSWRALAATAAPETESGDTAWEAALERGRPFGDRGAMDSEYAGSRQSRWMTHGRTRYERTPQAPAATRKHCTLKTSPAKWMQTQRCMVRSDQFPDAKPCLHLFEVCSLRQASGAIIVAPESKNRGRKSGWREMRLQLLRKSIALVVHLEAAGWLEKRQATTEDAWYPDPTSFLHWNPCLSYTLLSTRIPWPTDLDGDDRAARPESPKRLRGPAGYLKGEPWHLWPTWIALPGDLALATAGVIQRAVLGDAILRVEMLAGLSHGRLRIQVQDAVGTAGNPCVFQLFLLGRQPYLL